MRVLVVDDHPESRLLLSELLASHGYQTIQAASGLQALDLARKSPPDLIISDILMPEMDGYTLCRAIQGIEALRDVPFIFYTATYQDRQDEELGLALGAARYIRKPQEPWEFLRIIDEVVSARRQGTLASKPTHGRTPVELERGHQASIATKLEKKMHDLDRLRQLQALILDSACEGILGLDLDGNHTLVNDTAARLLGYDTAELIGRSSHASWHHTRADGSPYAEADCPIQAICRTGRSQHQVEDLFWRKDNSSFPVEYSCSPLLDQGRIQGVVLVFRDISQRKRAEEHLRYAASVFENTSEAVVITDAQGNIVDVNRAFTHILGYAPEDVLGRNPRLWQSGRHDRGFYQGMWKALEETGNWRGEIWNRRKDGALQPEWMTINSVRDETGQVSHYVSVCADISQVKQSQEQLDHLAHHDALTDLPNRLLLNERLEQAIRHAERQGTQLAVMFLDLDNFKHINDSLGHPVGDQLLQQVARQLVDKVRHEDTVARIGGDEFVLLLTHMGDATLAALLAEKIMNLFATSMSVDGQDIHATASLGISIYPRDGEDAATLLRNADAAMYRAKEEGRNTYRFYTEELTHRAIERVTLENGLQQALRKDQLSLVYQPQIDLESGRLVGIEALLRWRHPHLGSVPPARFIPVAEACGLIHPIGHWLLGTACRQARTWIDQGLDFGRMAVNIAGAQIQRGDLPSLVEQALAESGLPAERLELEVTEDFIMQQTRYADGQLLALRHMGVALAIDDFGTGYSSLNHLRRLPIHKIKIDQSFIDDIPTDPNGMTIVQAVIALANSLGLVVIAEGVENRAQSEFLQAAGCHQAQGFLYARPDTAVRISQNLADWCGGGLR